MLERFGAATVFIEVNAIILAIYEDGSDASQHEGGGAAGLHSGAGNSGGNFGLQHADEDHGAAAAENREWGWRFRIRRSSLWMDGDSKINRFRAR